MNLKKTTKKGVCHAMRCKEKAEYVIDASWMEGEEGHEVELCLTHVEQAMSDFSIDDEDAFVPLGDEKEEAPQTEERKKLHELTDQDRGAILNLYFNHKLDPSAISIKLGIGVSAVKAVMKELDEETGSSIVLSDESKKIAKDTQQEGQELLSELSEFTIDGQDDLDFAAEVTAEVKGKWKRLDDEEKKITKPLNDALKAARDLFREPKRMLKSIEADMKEKIGAFRLLEEENNAAALKAAAEAHKAGDSSARKAALKKMGSTADTDGVSVSFRWEFVIEDAEEVPREFLTVNEAAIREHIKGHKKDDPPPNIPGVRFVLGTTVSSKSA